MMKAITGLQRVFVFKGTEERGCKEQEDIFMLILQLRCIFCGNDQMKPRQGGRG